MKTYLDENNNLVFTYHSLSDNLLLRVQYQSENIVHQKRLEYEEGNRIQRGFLKYLAKSGAMDCVFPKSVVRSAALNGTRPKNYQVHHIVPLSCGGDNSFDNLMLVHKDIHAEIHSRIWTEVYKALALNPERRFGVDIPLMPLVMTPMDRLYLLDIDEIRKVVLSEKCKRNKQKYFNGGQICVVSRKGGQSRKTKKGDHQRR